MFDIFKKRSEVVVDVFSSIDIIYQYFKIQPATMFFPEWWKKMPKSYIECNDAIGNASERPTIRLCSGIIELYKKSFIMPLWTDLRIRTEDNGQLGWELPSDYTKIHEHPSIQTNFHLNNIHTLKLCPPFILKSNKDLSFYCTEPFWNNVNNNNWPKDAKILPGIIDTSITAGLNVFLTVPREKNAFYEFNAGDPLVNIIPITEDKIVFKHHLVTREEYSIKQLARPFFLNGGIKLKRLKNFLTKRGKD